MFNSTTLEVAIGLALIYLIVSLFCTAVNEALAGFLNTRARNLERGIRSLFTEGNLVTAVSVGNEMKTRKISMTDAIYDHGLVQSLYRCSGTADGTAAKDLKKPPAYIPSRTFASALYDILFANIPATTAKPADITQQPPPDGAAEGKSSDEGVPKNPATPPKGADVNLVAAAQVRLQHMVQALNGLPDGPAKQAMLALVKEANGDAARTRAAFERWYDDGMDRAAGWFKRSTQMNLFFIGLAMAVVLNVDTIQLGRALWTTPAMREYAVASADTYAKNLASVAKPGEPVKQPDNATAGTAAAPPYQGDGQPSAPASAGSPPTNPSAPIPNTAASGTLASTPTHASDFVDLLHQLDLPIGWSQGTAKWWYQKAKPLFLRGLFLSLFGWVLTAIAVTLGAPFWFDTLNQFMVVRSTIKPREKSEVEGSKDPMQK